MSNFRGQGCSCLPEPGVRCARNACAATFGVAGGRGHRHLDEWTDNLDLLKFSTTTPAGLRLACSCWPSREVWSNSGRGGQPPVFVSGPQTQMQTWIIYQYTAVCRFPHPRRPLLRSLANLSATKQGGRGEIGYSGLTLFELQKGKLALRSDGDSNGHYVIRG